MNITWAAVVIRDLQHLQATIKQDRLMAARRMVSRIREAVELLSEFPAMGRAGEVGDMRELVVAQTPYIVVYCVEQDELEIARVLHGAQLWPAPEDVPK